MDDSTDEDEDTEVIENQLTGGKSAEKTVDHDEFVLTLDGDGNE